jgi:hypothetical protein
MFLKTIVYAQQPEEIGDMKVMKAAAFMKITPETLNHR